MTQEQLNKIQEFTKTITNPKLLGIIRRLKQSAEKKTNPTPEDQANYITELVNAKLLAPVAVTAM
ncbi:MAG: enhanced serine sensitivity protein SseB, partial [Ruminiclostridium sp.]|nr:enhanced serine sensitivity protein SseB [Ruminiclostridium sp.]